MTRPLPRGYFGVAMYHPKHSSNVGTLWRSAHTYGAAFIAAVGRRYEKQSSDTCKTPLSTPLHHYADMTDLLEHLPHGCQLIGVELDERSVRLDRFEHPRSALYLMGAEDSGLPPSVLELCHEVVQIPTPGPMSLNVSVAGSVLMHDRFARGISRRIVAA
jgi:tRNA G18 (ribose-2'-O)-methylase SpoU